MFVLCVVLLLIPIDCDTQVVAVSCVQTVQTQTLHTVVVMVVVLRLCYGNNREDRNQTRDLGRTKDGRDSYQSVRYFPAMGKNGRALSRTRPTCRYRIDVPSKGNRKTKKTNHILVEWSFIVSIFKTLSIMHILVGETFTPYVAPRLAVTYIG